LFAARPMPVWRHFADEITCPATVTPFRNSAAHVHQLSSAVAAVRRASPYNMMLLAALRNPVWIAR
jgi:hypothetical protein